jgi:hypothetical protein
MGASQEAASETIVGPGSRPDRFGGGVDARYTQTLRNALLGALLALAWVTVG